MLSINEEDDENNRFRIIRSQSESEKNRLLVLTITLTRQADKRNILHVLLRLLCDMRS